MMTIIPYMAQRCLKQLGLSIILLTSFLAAAPSPTQASTVIALDDADLVKDASIVVYARIGKSETLQFGTRIATRYDIEVLEMIKGEAEVTHFLTRGGQFGDFAQTVTGEASFSQNQEVILFLEPIKAYDSELLLLGLSQGAVYVDDAQDIKNSRMLKTPKKRIRRAQNDLIRLHNGDKTDTTKPDGSSLDAYLVHLRAIAKAQNTGPLSSHQPQKTLQTLPTNKKQPSETP